MQQKLFISLILAAASQLHASEVVYSSLYIPFNQYPNIGDVRTPNEESGWLVPFKTGSEASSIDYLTLEHYNDGNPNSRPVNVQVFKNNNPFLWPSAVGDSELVGSLTFTGLEARDTRWPGATTFEHYEPSVELNLDADTGYFLYIVCDPDATADLLMNYLSDDQRAALVPGWSFGTTFRGDMGFPVGADVVMELAVNFPSEESAPVPEPSTVLGSLLLFGVIGARFLRRKSQDATS